MSSADSAHAAPKRTPLYNLHRELGAKLIDAVRTVAPYAVDVSSGVLVSAMLVSGDMSMGYSGTITYNDGKRILAFGHPFYNLGPIDMPMAKSASSTGSTIRRSRSI